MKSLQLKQIISMILMMALLMQFTVFIHTFAEDDKEAYTESVKLLNDLVHFNAEELDAKVSRGDFAMHIANLLGVAKNATIDKRYFKDVDPNSREAYAIHNLYERGVMKGTGENIFSPDDLIEPKSAAVVMLRIAGYSAIVENDNYDSLIGRYGLLSGISGYTITGYEAAEIICRALEIPVCGATSFGVNGAEEYAIDKEHLLIQELFDIYTTTGVIMGAANITISDTANISAGNILVDDKIYQASAQIEDEAVNSLGMAVEVYVRKTDNAEEIVHFSVSDSNKITDISIKDMTKPVGNDLVISYYKNDRVQTYALPKNVKVIKNGELISSKIPSAFNQIQGSIRIIESKNMTVAVISAYDSVLVSGVDYDSNMIYAKHGEKIEFDTDSLDRCVLYLADGSKGTIDDIKNGMMLTVYRSKNYLEIYVSSKSISGIIENIGNDRLKIGGTEYEIEPAYVEVSNKSLRPGSYGTFIFNTLGEIAYFFESYGTAVNYGVIVNALVEGVWENTLKLKLFTSNGEMKSAECIDEVKIDGNKLNAKEAYDALVKSGGGIVSQVVTYDADADGKIKAIDTIAKNADNTGMSISSPMASKAWFPGGRILMPDTVLKESGVVFRTPTRKNMAKAQDKDFAVGVDLLTGGDTKYNAEAYTSDKDGFYSDAILIEMDDVDYEIHWADAPLMVAEVYEKLDSDGEIKKVIKVGGMAKGSTSIGSTGIYEYIVSDELETPIIDKNSSTYINYIGNAERAEKRVFVTADDVSPGDIVFLKQDNHNEVVRIFMYHDCDNENFNISDIDKYKVYPGSEGRMVAGYVLERDEKYMAMSTISPLSEKYDDISYYGTDTTPAVIYDPDLRENQVYLGSIKDVLSAEEVGENASVVIPFAFRGNNRLILVYR